MKISVLDSYIKKPYCIYRKCESYYAIVDKNDFDEFINEEGDLEVLQIFAKEMVGKSIPCVLVDTNE